MWKEFDKEKPTKSGEYVTISENGAIANLPWSQKHQCFNARDYYEVAEFAIHNILNWAYFDDVYPKDSRFDNTTIWKNRGTNR